MESVIDVDRKLNEIINTVKGTSVELAANDNFIEILNMDSMDIIQLIVGIQQHFGIDIFGDQIDIDVLNEYGKLLSYIEQDLSRMESQGSEQ